jgi:hypothetical protein
MMEKFLSIAWAIILLSLTGCHRDVEGISFSSEPSKSGAETALDSPDPSPDPADEAEPEQKKPTDEKKIRFFFPGIPKSSAPPELPKDAPRLVMAVQEYFSLSDPLNLSFLGDSFVEIPCLEGTPEKTCADVKALEEDWEEYKTAPYHIGSKREIRTFPYVNSKWVQAVVHDIVYPSYLDYGNTCSLNYSLDEKRIVTVEEMLERMSLTPELFLEKLQQADFNTVILFYYYDEYTPREVEVQAFQEREDGSVVFYLRTQFLSDIDNINEYHYLFTYDTRDGSFFQFRGDKPGSFRDPPNLMEPSVPTLQWERDAKTEKKDNIVIGSCYDIYGTDAWIANLF